MFQKHYQRGDWDVYITLDWRSWFVGASVYNYSASLKVGPIDVTVFRLFEF